MLVLNSTVLECVPTSVASEWAGSTGLRLRHQLV